jgi:hypothetical protein
MAIEIGVWKGARTRKCPSNDDKEINDGTGDGESNYYEGDCMADTPEIQG